MNLKDNYTLIINLSRSDDYGMHTKAYVTGLQNQWGANEANLERLLQMGPVATDIKVCWLGLV